MPTNSESVQAIDQLIDRIGQLHASPTVAQKLLSLTRNSDFEIAKVAACLEQDPALAARILRVVNSSRYGLTRKVSSIRHAAAYLGQRSLKMFAISFALVETLTSRNQTAMSENFWPRAMTTATSAGLLCETQGLDCRDDAYTSGLLADVGILILAQLETQRYEPIFAMHRHGRELLDAERDEFQFTHALLGARLLQVWEVPDGVVKAVANHHQSDAGGDPLVDVIQTADTLSAAINDPSPENLSTTLTRLRDDYGLGEGSLSAFLDALTERLQEGEDLSDCGNILTKRMLAFRESLAEDVELSDAAGTVE